jgi:hypothetical protein
LAASGHICPWFWEPQAGRKSSAARHNKGTARISQAFRQRNNIAFRSVYKRTARSARTESDELYWDYPNRATCSQNRLPAEWRGCLREPEVPLCFCAQARRPSAGQRDPSFSSGLALVSQRAAGSWRWCRSEPPGLGGGACCVTVIVAASDQCSQLLRDIL